MAGRAERDLLRTAVLEDAAIVCSTLSFSGSGAFARMARAFDRWRKFDPSRQQHARRALEQIRAVEGLSKDSFEVVSRALA